MNSTLQCLSNTPFFISNYFLPAKHLSEVNKSNPLGHKGLLAMEFGNLVKEMWSGEYRALAPSKFKRVISDFAPQFDGYAQHDSHELLAFLLDGIHEDLNRVTKKVPTPAVESNGRSDQIVVRESWATYKIRNQSIVVDLFMGMLKSTVICPEPSCGRVSITFDPFRYLTVPLPQFNDRQLILTLCSQSNTPLVNYGIILPEHATVAQLKERLANLCGLAVHRLLICDVHKSKLYRVLMDSKRVSTIRETDVLVAYEILPEAFQSVVTPSTSVAGGSSISVSSNSSSGSSSSNNSSSLTYAAVASPVPQLRDNMVYLQAIHKSILVDARGNQTMSPRFGIPICLTTTPQLSNLRIHQLVAQAIERWTPIIPGRKELPYTVRVVDHTCSRCGFCSESSNCGGCCLPETDRPCGLDGGFALCILWETDVIARMVKTSMDDAHIIDHASVALKVRTDNSVTLAECLDLFSSKETLSKEDAWYCSGKCKTFRQATKQLQLFHCPEVLVVHLKRFLQINRIRREKQTTLVDFPIKGLDLSPFVPPHALEGEAYPIYDLYAVSNHAGGLSGGHYTSFVQASGRWYLFDDSRVSEVPVANIKTQYAYCLFYRRRA
jgi:ubiquitin C-terminal hydrolase